MAPWSSTLPPAPRLHPLEIDLDLAGAPGVARLSGELDLLTQTWLADVLRGLLDRGHRRLDLDLSEVGFISCSAFSVLVGLTRTYHDAGGRLALIHVPGPVRRTMVLARLDGRLVLG